MEKKGGKKIVTPTKVWTFEKKEEKKTYISLSLSRVDDKL